MYRGTTPTLRFNLPFDPVTIAEVWITMAQRGVEIINKTLTDCIVADTSISFELTQEETLRFLQYSKVSIQIRVRFDDGLAAASRIYTLGVDEILREGVI